MANITVEFKDEKKIVTYPDGKISEYPKTKIESHKQELIKRKQLIDRQIADLDKDLSDIEAAKVKPVGEENLG
jgi:hypothetical protein